MSTENLENVKKKDIELECQTDLTGQHILEMQQCINTMTCELAELKKKLLETDLTEDNLKDNDEKTALYTGLPIFLVFIQVLKLCDAFMLPTATNSLTKFQEILLVRMRLRLNIPFQDLAYRFGISRGVNPGGMGGTRPPPIFRLGGDEYLIVPPQISQSVHSLGDGMALSLFYQSLPSSRGH